MQKIQSSKIPDSEMPQTQNLTYSIARMKSPYISEHLLKALLLSPLSFQECAFLNHQKNSEAMISQSHLGSFYLSMTWPW